MQEYLTNNPLLGGQFIIGDESYDERVFVLACITTPNLRITELPILQARKRFFGKDRPQKRVCPCEIDDHVAYRFPFLRPFILDRIGTADVNIYAVYSWKGKTNRYDILLTELLRLIPVCESDKIIFDAGATNTPLSVLKNDICSNLSLSDLQLTFADSQEFKSIQTIDFVAASIRRSLNSESRSYIELIEKKIAKIKQLT